MTHFLIRAAIDLLWSAALACAAAAPVLAYSRSRRASVAGVRFALDRAPRWLGPVMAVCLMIPGPQDEIVVFLLALWPVLRSRESRAEFAAVVRAAWHGEPATCMHGVPAPCGICHQDGR